MRQPLVKQAAMAVMVLVPILIAIGAVQPQDPETATVERGLVTAFQADEVVVTANVADRENKPMDLDLTVLKGPNAPAGAFRVTVEPGTLLTPFLARWGTSSSKVPLAPGRTARAVFDRVHLDWAAGDDWPKMVAVKAYHTDTQRSSRPQWSEWVMAVHEPKSRVRKACESARLNAQPDNVRQAAIFFAAQPNSMPSRYREMFREPPYVVTDREMQIAWGKPSSARGRSDRSGGTPPRPPSPGSTGSTTPPVDDARRPPSGAPRDIVSERAARARPAEYDLSDYQSGTNVTLYYLQKRSDILVQMLYQWYLNGEPFIHSRLEDPFHLKAMIDIDVMEVKLVKVAGDFVDLNLKIFLAIERAMYIKSVEDRKAAINQSRNALKDALRREGNSLDDIQFDAAFGGMLALFNQVAQFEANVRVVQKAYELLKDQLKDKHGSHLAKRMIEAFERVRHVDYTGPEYIAWVSRWYPNIYVDSALLNRQLDPPPADSPTSYARYGTLTPASTEMQELAQRAAGGDAEALVALGHAFMFGKGLDRDREEAAQCYQAAAHLGSGQGQYLTGVMYENGTGVSQDWVRAREWYVLAAQHGVAGAYLRLGAMVFDGKDATPNGKEALRWFELAADKGDVDAFFIIGMLHYKGIAMPKDYEKAHEWLLKAARKRHARAQHNLALLYRKGRGVKADLNECIKWYRRSATGGFGPSMAVLGLHFQRKEEYSKALPWYRKGAKIGNRQCLYGMGSFYYSGHGVRQSKAKAFDYWQQCADLGSSEAQKNVLRMLEKGDGVPRDLVEKQRLRARYRAQPDSETVDPVMRFLRHAGLRMAIEFLEEMEREQ